MIIRLAWLSFFLLLLFHLLVIHQSVQHISICERRVHNEHGVEACVIDEANGTSISSKIFPIRISCSFFWHLYSGLRSQGCSLRHGGICISQTKIIEEFIFLNISILIFCNFVVLSIPSLYKKYCEETPKKKIIGMSHEKTFLLERLGGVSST